MFPCRISGRASNSPPTSIKWRAAAVTLRRGPPVTALSLQENKSCPAFLSQICLAAAQTVLQTNALSFQVRWGLHNPGINREKQLLFYCWSRQFLPALNRFHVANRRSGKGRAAQLNGSAVESSGSSASRRERCHRCSPLAAFLTALLLG